jgi:hypothetical protein
MIVELEGSLPLIPGDHFLPLSTLEIYFPKSCSHIPQIVFQNRPQRLFGTKTKEGMKKNA